MQVRARLASVVGEAGITDDIRDRQAFSEGGGQLPSYIVRPTDAGQVQGVVGIARECRLPLVPSSSGVRSYRAALPQEGGIVLDL
ncbi:MAG: hypothetical protein ACE5IA_09020, partial [Dehalococcoidia bacterium]